MPDFKNEFSWSHSRHQLFNTCLRAYYYNYYGYWGGWEASAPSRELYIMKNLSALPMWVGTRVHEVADEVTRGLPHRRSIPIEDSRRKLHDRMARDFRASRSGKYRADPKNILGLREHYYQLPLPDPTVKEYYDHGVQCVDNIYDGTVYAELAYSPNVRILHAEKRESISIDGINVWVVPDLIYQLKPNTAEVIDWKTGRRQRTPANVQLAIYAQFVSQRWQIPPKGITVRTVNLSTGTDTAYPVTQAMLDEAVEHIRSSAQCMQALLVDPANNRADIEAFPPTAKTTFCNYCNFSRACENVPAPACDYDDSEMED
jgi:hypothetical protein